MCYEEGASRPSVLVLLLTLFHRETKEHGDGMTHFRAHSRTDVLCPPQYYSTLQMGEVSLLSESPFSIGIGLITDIILDSQSCISVILSQEQL